MGSSQKTKRNRLRLRLGAQREGVGWMKMKETVVRNQEGIVEHAVVPRSPLVYRSFPERDGLQYFRAGPVAPSQSIVTANLFMCLLCPRTSNWILIFSTQLEQG